MMMKMMTCMMMTYMMMLMLVATVRCTPLKSTACSENDQKCIEEKIWLENFKILFLKALGLDAPPTYNATDAPSKEVINSHIRLIEADKMHNRNAVVFNCAKPLTEKEDGNGGCSFELTEEKDKLQRADEAMLEVYIREDFTRTVPVIANLNVNGNRVSVTVDEQGAHSQKINITDLYNSWLSEQVNEKLKIFAEDQSVLAVDVLEDSSEHAPYLHVKWSASRGQRTTRSVDSGGHCSGPSPSACCPRDFKVNFTAIGWDWIVAPEVFNPGYCSGGCQFVHELETKRSKLVYMTMLSRMSGVRNDNLPKTCCVPVSFKAVSILYYGKDAGDNSHPLYKNMDDMIVTSCKCVL